MLVLPFRSLRRVGTWTGAIALVVFNVVKLSSLSESIFSCCSLLNLSFYFYPSPVAHCVVFHEKAKGNNLWLDCCTMIAVVTHFDYPIQPFFPFPP